MAEHEDVGGGEVPAKPVYEPTGHRRSTFTPAQDATLKATADALGISDDELAQAIAEETERSRNTGTIPVVPEAAQNVWPFPPVDAEPDVAPDAEPDSVPDAVRDALPDVTQDIAPDVQPDTAPAVEPDVAQGFAPDFSRDTGPGAAPAVVPEAAQFAAPEPEPHREPDTASGEPQRPVRRSLPQDELASVIEAEAGTGNTLDAMAQLEEQLQLRQQEAREFTEWENSMRAIGTPEAIAEVERARADFVDVVPPTGEIRQAAEPPASQPPADQPPAEQPRSDRPSTVYQIDDVADSELLAAPAPHTAPVSDIPPPPRMLERGGSRPIWQLDDIPPEQAAEPAPEQAPEFAQEQAPDHELHELIEPSPLSYAADLFPGFQPHEDFEGIDDLAETDPAEADVADSSEVSAEGVVTETDAALADAAETDAVLGRLFGPFPVTAEGVILPHEVVESGPIATPRIPADEQVIPDAEPKPLRVFAVEESSLEPTPLDHRVGRAARLFWLWFAANASIISLFFGGTLLTLGMSLRQAIVSALAGVAISFFPLGLGTLAGKWSGQPTMVVSRASFGLTGNLLPSLLALLTRLFWGAVLLWFLAAGTARIITGAQLNGALSEPQLTIIALAIGFLLALVVAYFGYALIAGLQLVTSIVAGILIVGLVALTWPFIDMAVALTVGDGPWILVVTGAVLVFSFVGLVWAFSSADLARYQRPGSSGASSMLWSTFGSTLPTFLLIGYGSVLAASNPHLAQQFVKAPLDALALIIPTWYPVPLLMALALSLLSGVVVTLYSGAFALQATGLRMPRQAAVVAAGAGLAVVAILIAFSAGNFTLVLRDLATSLAVPIAAWVGIFGAEMMIRNRRFEPTSLLHRGGVYPDVNWVNLAMLIVASAIGFGFTTATVSWLGWQGYAFGLLGISESSALAQSDIGVLVALIIGIVTPIVAGIPAIRRQERTPAPG